MAQQTQSSWSNNPADELSGDFDLRELRGAKLGEMNWTQGESADIQTTIYYLPPGPHQKVQKFGGVVHLMYDTDIDGHQPTNRPPQWTINPTQFEGAMSGYKD